MASSLGEGAIRDSWTLQVLGVAPEHHNKGVAKALVSRVREKVRPPPPHFFRSLTVRFTVTDRGGKADASGYPMCLEAEQPHNVRRDHQHCPPCVQHGSLACFFLLLQVGIYERLGFEAKGNKTFSNIYGSFSVWAMMYNPS